MAIPPATRHKVEQGNRAGQRGADRGDAENQGGEDQGVVAAELSLSPRMTTAPIRQPTRGAAHGPAWSPGVARGEESLVKRLGAADDDPVVAEH